MIRETGAEGKSGETRRTLLLRFSFWRCTTNFFTVSRGGLQDNLGLCIC